MPLNIKGNIISSTDITSVGVFKTKVNSQGLVLNLDAGDLNSYSGSGTAWNDLSGNGNNGTLYNSPTFNSANGGHFIFNGVNNYVLIPYNVTLKPTIGNTVECFAYIESNGTWSSLIQSPQTNGAHTANYFDYAIYLNADRSMHTRIDGEGTTSSASVFSFNVWNQFAITWANNLVCFYVNGKNVGTTTDSKTTIVYDNNTDNLIGQNAAGGEQFKGKVAIARIYDKALSPFEIAENFQAQRGRFGI